MFLNTRPTSSRIVIYNFLGINRNSNKISPLSTILLFLFNLQPLYCATTVCITLNCSVKYLLFNVSTKSRTLHIIQPVSAAAAMRIIQI